MLWCSTFDFRRPRYSIAAVSGLPNSVYSADKEPDRSYPQSWWILDTYIPNALLSIHICRHVVLRQIQAFKYKALASSSRILFFLIVLHNDFSDRLRKINRRYKITEYETNEMWHSACLLVSAVTVGNFAAFLNTIWPVDDPDLKGVYLAWAWWFVLGRVHRGLTVWLLLLWRLGVTLAS